MTKKKKKHLSHLSKWCDYQVLPMAEKQKNKENMTVTRTDKQTINAFKTLKKND